MCRTFERLVNIHYMYFLSTNYQCSLTQNQLPRLAPFQGGMKMAIQISPLLNLYSFQYIIFFNVFTLSWSSIEVCVPNAISREPDFSQKIPGNFPSQAFWKILFPVLSQSRQSELANSCPVSVPKMKREFPNWKFRKKFLKFSTGWEISCWILKYVIYQLVV